MYEPLRRRMLAWLKVPPEPHPPQGDPASLRVFRAGRNYYRLRMIGWGVAQLFALAGILFWTGMLIEVERIARAEQASPAPAVGSETGPRTNETVTPPPKQNQRPRFDVWRDRFVKNLQAAAREPRGPRAPLARWWAGAKRLCIELALVMPSWVFPLAWALKIIGFVVYLVQLGITYAARRLDYEMRWYLVTDRSLRLRHGVWVVWESTMSFANIQQVVVSQGPLQRLLGLSNVKVESAGGGTRNPERPSEDMHVGYFHSVTNAEEIRDLILERLRRFRESGLGDPDERPALTPTPTSPESNPLLVAARELAAEANALRTALNG